VELDQGAPFLAEDEQPRRIAIQAMGELEEPRLRPGGAQRLDHAEADPAAAVDRHARGLVDHQDLGVLVNDRELERPGRRLLLRHPDRRQADAVAGPQPVIGPHPAAVDPDFAAPEHAVDVAFRHAFQLPQQEVVDPLAFGFLADFEPPCPRLA
jgi:hypothetical protein